MGRYDDCFKAWSPAEFKVANARIATRAKKTFCGRMCTGCGLGCYDKRTLYCLYWCVACFLIAAAGTLIGVGCGVVLPFRLTKDFKETTCNVSRADYDTKRPGCGCGKHCSSSYPCLEIYVNYTRFDDTQVSSMLFENEYTGECTYQPNCERDYDGNARKVKDYQAEYGSGNYSCLYDPTVGSTRVIRTQQLTEAGMMHALIWPAAFVVISFILLVIMLVTCGCKYVYELHAPQDIKEAVAVKAQQETPANHDTLKTNYGFY